MKTLFTILFFSAGIALAQSLTVTGKVTDENGDGLPGVSVIIKGTTTGTVTDLDGNFSIEVPGPDAVLVLSCIGMTTQEIKIGKDLSMEVEMSEEVTELQEVVVSGYGVQRLTHKLAGAVAGVKILRKGRRNKKNNNNSIQHVQAEPLNESYAAIEESGFKNPMSTPLSTFSADVDVASYANIRRFIKNGQLPPKDAVRIEEMINYFDYQYEQPNTDHPFSINTELSETPWNEDHLLVQIGLQGKDIELEELPRSNLVFLIDVSGSMSDANKLPLVKSSLKMLVRELRPNDRISIVTYSGSTRVAMRSKKADKKAEIFEAIDALMAGGGTAGGRGLKLAYEQAENHFIKNGNNRIILATDGDFNIGMSSDSEMEKLIEKKRESGIFLSVLGYGMGNYKDSKMEILADKGNGNYAYIDDLFEAKKVLVDELGGTLFTIAKDVKIQVEFNPSQVQAYRLIGHENRLLEEEDFEDDEKDAGEIGAGHSVTALYEIIPQGVKSDWAKMVSKLKYQRVTGDESNSDELLTVKFRYKDPNADQSLLITNHVVKSDLDPGDNISWASSVAAFGMILRESEYLDDFDMSDVLKLAKASRGHDVNGYRSQFIQLAEMVQAMSL